MARGKKKETLTSEERLQAALVPASEQPYKVPGNWTWVKVGDLCTFIGGGTPDKTNPLYWNGNISWASVKDIKGSYLYSTIDKISQLGLESSSSNLCEAGDLLLVTRIEPAKTIVSKIVTAINQDLKIVKSELSSLFLYHYFCAFQHEFEKKASGSTVKGITLPNIQNTPFPLPPLPEQHRIVDRIESLFAKLDEAKQKAQDALDSFETRKAAILHKAFTGELTAQWRKEHGVGMETWSSCKLIDILVEKPRNGYSPKPVDYVTACKSMTLSATTTGVFKPEFFKYIDEEIPENSHLWLTPGDILIQRANSLEKVGMSAIYTGAEHEFIYPDLMMKLTVKEPNNKHYIDYYLKTDEILNYFRSNATGTAGNMPKINQKVVSETPLILPETQEQAEIVRLLDDLLANEQQAKEAAEGVLEQIDLIKKAILARAFRGELGTNDPSEESAVELLKQISSC